MQAELERALHFVTAHGDPVEQARLRYILTGVPVAGATLDALLAGQRADGGWAPFWAPGYSALDATCYRLAQADQLGTGALNPAIQCALGFFAARQAADGHWAEADQVAATAPPWAAPGDPAATAYLTANCGFWMAVLAGRHASAAQAAAYLAARLDPDGRLPGFLHTQWLAAGLWYALEQADPAARALAGLGTRLNETVSAGSLAWLITTLARAGVPGAHPLLQTAAALLAAQQVPDGRWPSDDGPERAVHTTLEAIRALRACRRV